MLFRRLFPCLLAAAALGLPSIGCSQDTSSDKAFDDKVRAYLLSHPEVIEEAMAKLEADKEAKAAEASSAGIAQNKTSLERDPGDFVANPGGRVTVVEFFDYKCPYCKTSAEQVVKLIHDNPDVRFVFKEFPILSDISGRAAEGQLASRGQGHYLQVFQGLMKQAALNDDTLAAVFKENGVDLAAAETPQAKATAQKHLSENRALAHAIGVDGTPAFIVDGKRIDGWSPDDLEAGIAAERSKLKSAQAGS